jgi:PIN domain nuclease of toxin-antitoxin system
MNFVTDTHALIWWCTDSPRISPRVVEIFEGCESGQNIIFIPSIVLAETLSIFEKKRITFDFRRLLKRIEDCENFVIIPLDYPILQKMIDLKDIIELHDKIIVATAKYLNVSLITKDSTLEKIPYIRTAW